MQNGRDSYWHNLCQNVNRCDIGQLIKFWLIDNHRLLQTSLILKVHSELKNILKFCAFIFWTTSYICHFISVFIDDAFYCIQLLVCQFWMLWNKNLKSFILSWPLSTHCELKLDIWDTMILKFNYENSFFSNLHLLSSSSRLFCPIQNQLLSKAHVFSANGFHYYTLHFIG